MAFETRGKSALRIAGHSGESGFKTLLTTLVAWAGAGMIVGVVARLSLSGDIGSMRRGGVGVGGTSQSEISSKVSNEEDSGFVGVFIARADFLLVRVVDLARLMFASSGCRARC